MLSKVVTLLRRLRPPLSEPAGPQYGALPYTVVEGQLVVLLITSRGRASGSSQGRADRGDDRLGESAAHEAYEEAGVTGEIEQTPIGRYFLPVTEERPQPVEVDIFPLRVTGQREDWQEKGQRYRHWAVLAEARRLITHDGLADVALALAQRELGSGKPQSPKTTPISQ